MSLESALRETEQRYQEEQAKAAREEVESREFSKRVIVLRNPSAVVAHMKDLHDMLPEGAAMHMEALRRSYPNMDRLILAPNVSSFSTLGGHVLVLHPDQVISQMSHVVNVKSPFGVTMAVRVRDAVYTSAKDMRDKYYARVVDYVRSLRRTGPALETHAPSPESTEDSARWPIFFPSKRTHAGLYTAPNGDLFLITRSHAGEEVLPGVRAVVDKAGTTARDFIESPSVKWMQSVAYRNAARLLSGLASFLGFTVPTAHDFQSHSGSRRLVRYRMAVPDIVHYHDTQRMTTVWGAPRAAFYRDVIDGGQGSGEAALVQSDITQGYAMSDFRNSTSSDTPAILPLTTDKIPLADRLPFTVDQRDQYTEKISSLMPRRHLLKHHKYHGASRGTALSPVAVVRS